MAFTGSSGHQVSRSGRQWALQGVRTESGSGEVSWGSHQWTGPAGVPLEAGVLQDGNEGLWVQSLQCFLEGRSQHSGSPPWSLPASLCTPSAPALPLLTGLSGSSLGSRGHYGPRNPRVYGLGAGQASGRVSGLGLHWSHSSALLPSMGCRNAPSPGLALGPCPACHPPS